MTSSSEVHSISAHVHLAFAETIPDCGAHVQAFSPYEHYFLAPSASVRLSESMVAVIPKRSRREVQREVKAINGAAKHINKSAASSKKFLYKHGFITKDKKVSAHYHS